MTRQKHPEDWSLAQRCQEGEERAMHTLYQQHHKRIYAMALRLTGSRADAEDVTQDAFIRAFRFIKSYRGDSSLGTWLCRIAINLSRDFHKKAGRDRVPPKSMQSEKSEDFVSRKKLQTALGKLPNKYREVLVMHDILGMDHGEISQVMKIKVGTSKSQLHKARARMRELITSGEPGGGVQ